MNALDIIVLSHQLDSITNMLLVSFLITEMMDVKIFTILIALVCLKNQLVSCDNANYCYSDDEHPYLLFDTKTAYEFTHGLIKNTTVPSNYTYSINH